MTNPDVVIVGAGAAGVGAGLELRERGIPFVILEAAPRVGGRAFTDRVSLPGQWDQGCQWFHCADQNPLVAWADRLGTVYEHEDRIEAALLWSRDHWADAAENGASRGAIHAAIDAIYQTAGRGDDVPIAEVIPEAGQWAPSVRHILQLLASDDPERVSAKGYADYDDTGVNWIVSSGYGDLIERMAAGLPIRLGTAVTRIEQGAGGVRVATSEGTIAARAAIVTVSTNVLNSGSIGFGPGPANDLLDKVQYVPCGTYEKVALALRHLPPEIATELFCWIDAGAGKGASDFQISGGAHPKMIAHMAGGLARDVLAGGKPAMVDFALERLAAAFGSGFRKLILSSAITGFQANPLIQGAYSYSKPGHTKDRHDMIAVDTGSVAFAGEAFSRRWQATAHGAYQSGRDVAARVGKAIETV
ncbi:MAG: NAD(P)/FAD-dependent oxidoreductase [Albidovulum sp.]